MKERTLRTLALIIKRRDFGEADRLLTVLTPSHGKMDVIAKGARKPSSTKTGHVELFTRAELLIHRGRELHIATQAVMQESYLPLREDLTRGAYASYAAELLDRFTLEGDDELGGLYALLDAALKHISFDDDPRLAVRYYELHLLDQVGFRPELQECVFTHEPLQPRDQFFSVAEGGVVSPEAARHTTALTPITVNTLKLLRHIQRSPYEQVKSLTISPAIHAEVERILLGYITYLLERQLQSVEFIRRIRN